MIELGTVKRGKELNKKPLHSKFIWHACEVCGKERWVHYVKEQPRRTICWRCSMKITLLTGVPQKKMSLTRQGMYTREKNPAWKGGRKKSKGYISLLLTPDNFFFPMAVKYGITYYVLEHRLVVAQHLGRCLQSWEFVHHKNGIKDDNRIENLEIATNGQHIFMHNKGYRDGYQKGLQDGRLKQIQKLKDRIKELE